MSHRQHHTIEKVVVQLTALAALAVVYFFAYPAASVWDGQSAAAFLPTGSFTQAAVFSVMVTVLAAACSLMTVSARPEGAMLAVFVAAGGISLHSPRFATLLWTRQDGYSGLFHVLILEMFFMAVLLALVVMVVKTVRFVVGRIKPEWVWKSPLQDKPADGGGPGGKSPRPSTLPGTAGLSNYQMLVGRSAVSLSLGMLAAIILLLILMQSSQRGQVIFSLLVSFTLAVLIAQKLMPSPFSEVFLVMPILVGILFYALASVASVGESVQDWIHVPQYARVLPIDWLTAGCAGAALGYWLCQRFNESAYFESLKTTEGN